MKINKYIMCYLSIISFSSANNSQINDSNFLIEKRDDINNQCLYDAISFTWAFIVTFYVLGVGIYLATNEHLTNKI